VWETEEGTVKGNEIILFYFMYLLSETEARNVIDIRIVPKTRHRNDPTAQGDGAPGYNGAVGTQMMT
jgi:hypothetical protein